MALNNFCFFGNVGQDPTEKYFNDGKDLVTDVSVALNPGGEKMPTIWYNCRFRGKVSSDGNNKSIAERAFEEIKKGTPVIIEGRMASYERGEGDNKQVVQYIEARSFMVLEKKQGEGRSSNRQADEIPV